MHVLVTTDTIGGVWSYTRELVQGLLQRGHEVTLVSLGRLLSEGQASWVRASHLNFYPTDFPLEWMPNSETGVTESSRYVTQLISTCKPDVLHTNQFCYGAMPCDIPKVLVAHSDVVSWWHSVHACEPPASHWATWYRSLVVKALATADLTVTPSQWMLDALTCYYDRPQRAKVIYNGRSRTLFDPAGRKAARALSVGRVWDEGKQVSILLARDHSTPITIAGNTDHPAGTKTAPLPNNSANVTLCGEKDEEGLRRLFSESSTYVATSRYEPFGLAPLEAALSRCALVMNDIPVFLEIWGDAAIYFQRDDPDSLADAIQQLSEATDVREEYGLRAYSHAIKNYTAERMVDRYEDLYRALVHAGASA